jgi:3-phosphoshikimate 1-carboxyvinyltransferase
MSDLLRALRQLGIEACSERGDGYPPIVIHANGLKGGKVSVSGKVSSQFLSGLLMAAPLAREDTWIQIDGVLVSRPYLDMTIRMMQDFGVRVDVEGTKHLFVQGNQLYQSRDYNVEPDASAAGYWFAAAAISEGEIVVPDLGSGSLQGDLRFTSALQEMGCHLTKSVSSTCIKGWPLRGIDADMNDISDCVMTLGAVACFAEGPTTIRNVAHIRHKETDRLTALANELRKVGAEVDEFPDGLKITPRPLHGAEIETYNDHRMAMSMALIGLKVPGIVIRNPGCVAKTYPQFFDDLELLRK